MPLTLLIPLYLDADVPPQPREALHASVFGALAHVSPDLAGRVHAEQVSPFALQLKQVQRRRIDLRVTALRDEVGEALREAWTPGSLISRREGSLLPGQVGEIQLAPWDFGALVAPWEGARPGTRAVLRFTVPAALKRNDRVVRWPAPDLVWGGLARRWKHFGPALRTPLDPLDLRPVRLEVRDARITLHREGSRVSLPAFEGRAMYELGGASLETAGALLELARHVGVGTLTAYGFGQVEVEVRPG